MCVRIKKKLLLNMFRQIYKSASLGLRSLEREGRNETRLVLRPTFAPKN
jgi:hypothetical protein